MGWQDAPIIQYADKSKQPAWMSAPIVTPAAERMQQEFDAQKQQPGLVDQLKQIGVDRQQKRGEIVGAEQPGLLNGLQTDLQLAGNDVGLATDAIGAGVGALYNQLPDAVRNPINQAASGAFQAVSDSPVGTFLANEGSKQAAFAQANPQLARDLEAVNNIAQVVPVEKAIGLGNQLVARANEVAQPAIKGAQELAGNIATAPLPKIDDGILNIAVKARDYGIPLSYDELTSSRAVKTAQKVSQDLPFSGQAGFREKQLQAFNEAVQQTAGIEGGKFTPEAMSAAYKKLGDQFDSYSSGKVIDANGGLLDNLAELSDEAKTTYSDEVATTVQKQIDRVIDSVKEDGTITGEELNRLRKSFNQLGRKTNDFERKSAFRDLEGQVIDVLTDSDPQSAEAFGKLKQEYKNWLVLEPLANKAKGGNISPSLLNGRVAKVYGRAFTNGQAGPIGDLAQIGRELLPELGGSDTASRTLQLASVAGLANPFTASKTAAALGGNRAIQSGLNRNQSLIDSLLKKKISQLTPEEMKLLGGY